MSDAKPPGPAGTPPPKFCGKCYAGYIYRDGDNFVGRRCECNPAPCSMCGATMVPWQGDASRLHCPDHPRCGHPAAFGCWPGKCAVDTPPSERPPAPAAPVEAPVDIASRPELGAPTPARDAEGWTPDGRVVKKALDRLWDAPTPVEHPGPWRWAVGELRDANEEPLITVSATGEYGTGGEPDIVVSPRVREMLCAAPEMADELRWLVDNSVPTWDERGARRDRWVAMLARIDAAGKR